MKPGVHDISVIICAYTEKRWHNLVEAIASVRRQTLPAKEIILVVDYNLDVLKKGQEQLTGVIVVENTDAPGLRGARNSGIAIAQGAIIAFLDDDAIAIPNWLEALAEGFADPRVLGVGGAVTPLWVDREPAWFPEEFYWVVGCSYRGMPRTTSAIRNPIGANMAFRHEVFSTIGNFHSETVCVGKQHAGGCEETELCIRAQQHWPQRFFLYIPLARVFHRVPRGRTRWRYFCSRCYVEGLAKAVVSHYVGAKDSLSSERDYTLRSLPLGLLHGLWSGLLHHDLDGFARSGAIVAGLVITTVGYGRGRLALWINHAHIAGARRQSPRRPFASGLSLTTGGRSKVR